MQKTYFLALLLLLTASHLQSQNKSDIQGDSISFPGSYLGKWSGDLEIFTAQGLVQTIPMQLHILPINDSTFTYTIFYGEDVEAGKRDYLLRKGSQGNHHWVIDEQDGILLDNFYLGGTLFGPFTVAGSSLNSTLELRDEKLVYTISSGPVDSFSSSSSTIDEGGIEKTYYVEAFQVKNVQRAFLLKMTEKDVD